MGYQSTIVPVPSFLPDGLSESMANFLRDQVGFAERKLVHLKDVLLTDSIVRLAGDLRGGRCSGRTAAVATLVLPGALQVVANLEIAIGNLHVVLTRWMCDHANAMYLADDNIFVCLVCGGVAVQEPFYDVGIVGPMPFFDEASVTGVRRGPPAE